MTINKKEYGVHGACDTLIKKKYSIDYIQGAANLFDKNCIKMDSINLKWISTTANSGQSQ